MVCPECDNKLNRKGGGSTGTAYYFCRCCLIDYYLSNGFLRLKTDEPGQTFKSKREALRVLRWAVRDDRAWFDEVSEETEALARVVVGMLR